MNIIRHSKVEDINLETNITTILTKYDDCASEIARAIVRCETQTGLPINRIIFKKYPDDHPYSASVVADIEVIGHTIDEVEEIIKLRLQNGKRLDR